MPETPSQQPQARHINALQPCIGTGSTTSRFYVRSFSVTAPGTDWSIEETVVRPTEQSPLPLAVSRLVAEVVEDPRVVAAEIVKDCGNSDHPPSRHHSFLPPHAWRQTELVASMPIVNGHVRSLPAKLYVEKTPTLTSQALVTAVNPDTMQEIGPVHVMADGKQTGTGSKYVQLDGHIVPVRVAGQFVVATASLVPLIEGQPVDLRALMRPFER